MATHCDRHDFRNEHLARRRAIRRAYHDERRALHDEKHTLPRTEYRTRRRALREEKRAKRRTLRQERRAFFHKTRLPLYPIMADVFDVAEAARAPGNNRTPFDAEIRVLRDVVYRTVDGEDLLLDLYLPAAEAEGPRPVVMDIPGGGWMIHNRPRRDGYARCFAAMGAVVAVIDHRLCPRVHFPDNLSDCIEAYNYLVRHAGEYRLDPHNITVTGDSSGGHLTACLGCAATSEDYCRVLGLTPPLTKPAALIFVSGAFNFERMYHIPMTNTLIVRYVSGMHSRKAFRHWQYYRECNPQHYITPDYPACYNAGGATDLLCLGEARHMAKLLTAAGVPNEVRVGRNPLMSDHCYVLRFPYAAARRDALALYRWYATHEAALGVDLSAGFARVETFLSQYDDVMAGRTPC